MEQPASETFVTDPLPMEQQHLQKVISQIEEYAEHLQAIPSYFDSDDDEAETADEVAQAAVESMRDQQLSMLFAAQSEPYFGRLDFCEAGDTGPLVMYIGKRGIEDSFTGDRLVIDWRAPIASLFYSFSGKSAFASYVSPEGDVTGEVQLKRNILIRNQKLLRVVDSYVKGKENLNVTDEFLLYRLSEHKEHHLQDIVSTIQAEQDRIIRASKDLAMVIQGVAGSGKTTVALHRLAYLLYQHPEKLKTDRMVIFAPSAMFLGYISEVLPELGVAGVRQTTFAAWAENILDNTIRVKDARTRFAAWFNPVKSASSVEQFHVVRHKNSLEFKQEIESFLARLEDSLVPEYDFVAWDKMVLPVTTIQQWYRVDYGHYPLLARRRRVLARIKRWYELKYQPYKGTSQGDALRKLARQRFQAYERRWPLYSAIELYDQFLESQGLNPLTEDGGRTSQQARKTRRKSRVEVQMEDLAPLIFIHLWLEGAPHSDGFDHVVIDEAQDFSPFQLSILRAYCKGRSFTILGDLSQSIHTYQGITDWKEFLNLFDAEHTAFYELDVSYRSTMEIIEFANRVIEPFADVAPAKPVFRSGESVLVTRVSQGEKLEKLVNEIKTLQQTVETIAVVGRTEDDCNAYHRALRAAGIAASLLDSENQAYTGGVSVLPIYLTKGLEFDAVLLMDVTAANYPKDAENAKLLYVGCTRALHVLRLQFTGEMSPLLSHVPVPALR